MPSYPSYNNRCCYSGYSGSSRWFFPFFFLRVLWFCLLSGHDCAPSSSPSSPEGTGKNAINFRPCFIFVFFRFSVFVLVFGFVTYRFRSNDFFRPLFMCSISFVSGSCSLVRLSIAFLSFSALVYRTLQMYVCI